MLSSHYLPPWVADDVSQATRGAWRGQPVFRDRAAAFGWLDWGLNGRFRLLDMSIAEVRADTYARPGDVVRIRLDRAALLDPAAQIARGTPHAAGPHPSVLASWYSTTHAVAGTRWADAAPWTAHASAWITDVARTVWNHAYPLAGRDARTAVAARIADAAAAALGADPNGHARRGLARLRAIADQVTTADTRPTVPDVAARTVAAATDAVGDDADRRGWQRAVDRVWADALTAAALDTVLTTTTDIHTAWLAAAQPADERARVGSRELPAWIRATLADANRAVAQQWLTAAAATRPPNAPHPRFNARTRQPVPDEPVPARGLPRDSSNPPEAVRHTRTGKAFTPLAVLRPTDASPPGPMPPPDSTASPPRGRSR